MLDGRGNATLLVARGNHDTEQGEFWRSAITRRSRRHEFRAKSPRSRSGISIRENRAGTSANRQSLKVSDRATPSSRWILRPKTQSVVDRLAHLVTDTTFLKYGLPLTDNLCDVRDLIVDRMTTMSSPESVEPDGIWNNAIRSILRSERPAKLGTDPL